MTSKRALQALAAAAVCLASSAPGTAAAAAEFELLIADDANLGYLDPTPAMPVGGNTGTTVGQQRINALLAAARKWSSLLDSSVPITVLTAFNPLRCDANAGVVAATGVNAVFALPNAPRRNTWYPSALANKIAGVDLTPEPEPLTGEGAEIILAVNSNFGATGCVTGARFYYGLDGKPPAGATDLVAILLHELAHGLGFQAQPTNLSTGVRAAAASGQRFPSVWESFLYDKVQNRTWAAMTDVQRAQSAVNTRQVVWEGNNVTAAVPNVLTLGRPDLYVGAPNMNRSIPVGEATFGPRLQATSQQYNIIPVTDTSNATTACLPLSSGSATAVRGKLALVDRGGGCAFTVKVKNAQNAGAVGVLIADNVEGGPPPDMNGSDSTITIPAVRITRGDGALIRANLPAVGGLRLDTQSRAGADQNGRIFMYTPLPLEPGSSIGHFDTSARRFLVMQPGYSPGLSQDPRAPGDLTLELLKDIGW